MFGSDTRILNTGCSLDEGALRSEGAGISAKAFQRGSSECAVCSTTMEGRSVPQVKISHTGYTQTVLGGLILCPLKAMIHNVAIRLGTPFKTTSEPSLNAREGPLRV